jgi:hypothetical protein
MVNILTRNASGHLTLKAMAAGSLCFFPKIAIIASRWSGTRHPLRRVLIFSHRNRHTNVLDR